MGPELPWTACLEDAAAGKLGSVQKTLRGWSVIPATDPLHPPPEPAWMRG